MSTHRLTIKQSTLINLAGAMAPLVIMLITLPILLLLVGEFRYGALMLVWTLVNYMGVMDLGLGRATNNLVARMDAHTSVERASALWTSLTISFGMGLLGGLLVYALGEWVFVAVFSIPVELQAEVLSALPWILLALPLATMTSVLAGALEGRQAFVALSLANIIGAIITQLLPLFAALLGWIDLSTLIATTLAGRLLNAVLLFLACLRYVSADRPSFVKGHLDALLRFGGWVSVSSILHPVLTMTDRLVIGYKLDMAAVTTYTVPFNMATRLSIIPGSLSTVLFPRFSSSDNKHEASELMIRARLPLAVIMTPLIVLGMLLAEPFMSLWLGEGLGERMGPVAVILLAGIWINALAYIPFAYLQGLGRPDLTAKIHVAEVLPYLLVLWWAIDMWGVEGAALAWSIRVGVDALLLFILAKGAWPDLRPIMFGATLILASAILSLMAFDEVAVRIFGALVLLTATMAWVLKYIPEELRLPLEGLRRRSLWAQTK